jgi:multiple sugar transport system ATP-binding protein
MAAIEFDSVTKIYGDGVRAVSDLNLAVRDGEFVVLLGPSGCGKSTALRMVAGLEAISSGEIRIDGSRVNNVEPRERDVAMVFQNYALYPHMDVEDNIGFGLRVRGVPKPERRSRIKRAADVLGLTEHLQRKPSQLSGGQRQRVAMGRAIVRQPKAFLMDEPLSNLDARLRVQMRTEIVRIQREINVTTIYVTHDQIEAMTMADRVAVMRGGILQQVDTPDHVYSHPTNLFVASFIGSPAMNLIEGTLEQENMHIRCRVGSQAIEIPETVFATRKRLRQQIGSTVGVGIRPEGLSLRSSTTQPTLTGNVVISESLGFETLVYLDVDAKAVSRAEVFESLPDAEAGDRPSTRGETSTTTLVARLPAGTTVTEGESLALGIDPTRLEFFDLETGSAID